MKGALVEARRRGVAVKVLFSHGDITNCHNQASSFMELNQWGAEVRGLSGRRQHAKWLLTDSDRNGIRLVIGSANFTFNSQRCSERVLYWKGVPAAVAQSEREWFDGLFRTSTVYEAGVGTRIPPTPPRTG